jgi:hypothetical protein
LAATTTELAFKRCWLLLESVTMSCREKGDGDEMAGEREMGRG